MRQKHLISIAYKINKCEKFRIFVLSLLNYFVIAINIQELIELKLKYNLNRLLLILTKRLAYYYRLIMKILESNNIIFKNN